MALAAVTSKDTVDLLQREMRHHIHSNLARDLEILAVNGWITDTTHNLLLNALGRMHDGMELDSRSSTQPQPPPLPSRDSSQATVATSRPAAQAPYAVSQRSVSSSAALVHLSSQETTANMPSKPPSTINPYILKAAANPQIQKATYSAAMNPAVQKAAYSAAMNPSVQNAVHKEISSNPSTINKVAYSAAMNPTIQKHALKAAANPAVQKAAYSAAMNPAVQKGAYATASASFAAAGFNNSFLGGSSDTHRKRSVVAVADYVSTEEGDLAFRMGDLITVLEDVDDNWYKGELKGRQGIFPKNHVQIK